MVGADPERRDRDRVPQPADRRVLAAARDGQEHGQAGEADGSRAKTDEPERIHLETGVHSASPFPQQDHLYGLQENHHVEEQTVILYVIKIVLELFDGVLLG